MGSPLYYRHASSQSQIFTVKCIQKTLTGYFQHEEHIEGFSQKLNTLIRGEKTQIQINNVT